MTKKIASFLLVLFFAAAAAAEDGGSTALAEFLKSMADTVGQSLTGSINREIYTFIVSGRFSELAYAAGGGIPGLLVKELPLEDSSFISLSNLFTRLLQPFYVTALLSVGLYLIFFSGSPRGRAKAKFLFMVLLAGMLAVSLSTDIVRLLLQLSNTLTSEVLSRNPGDYAASHKASADYFSSYMQRLMALDVPAGIPFMFPVLLSAAGVYAVLLLRYVMLLFFTILFPAAIFLSFFNPTRGLGSTMLKQLLFWIFLPAGYAVSFVVVSVSGDAFISLAPALAGMARVSSTFFTLLFPVFFFVSVNWFAETFVRLEVLMQPIQSLAGFSERGLSDAVEEMRRKKKRAKKPSEDAGAALGLGGYHRVGLKEGGAEEGDEQKPYRTIPSVRPRALYGYGAGFAEHEPEHGVDAGEEASKDRGTYVHGASGISPEVRRRSALVAIPPQGMPFLEMELSEGEKETINIIVRNDTGRYIDKVMAFDDELEDAGLTIEYSANSFTLAPGEERLVKVSITAPKSFKKRFHEGSLVFKGGGGVSSIVDVSIKAQASKPLSGGKAVSSEEDSTILSLFGTTRAPLTKSIPPKHVTKGVVPKEEAIRKAPETLEDVKKETMQPKPPAGEAKEEKSKKVSGRSLERPLKTILPEEAGEKAGTESTLGAAGTKGARRFIEKAEQESQAPVRVTDSPKLMGYLMSLPRMHKDARLLKRLRGKVR